MTETDAAPAPVRMKPVDPRLLRYAAASRSFFVAAGALGLLQTVVIVAFAGLLTTLVVAVVDGRPLDPAAIAGFAGVIVLRAALVWARDAVAARAAARVQAQLRDRLLAAVGSLGPEWLATANSASLAVTAGRGLEALEAYFSRYLPQLVQTAIATPILLLVMWWQDWISGLTVLITLPLIPIFMVLIGLATRAVQQRQWATLRHLSARFADTVQGLATLKVFGRQHRAAASVDRVTDTYRRETMRVLRVSFLSGFALEFLASVSVAVVAVSIGFRLLDGTLVLAVGLFVLLLAPEAYLPLRQVGVQFHAAAEGVAATDDVFAVLDAAAGIPPRPVAERVDASAPGLLAVTLRDLRVRGLAPVSLVAEPGTVTLIEGPSGSGKSSLLAALRGAIRFEGTATVADEDVRMLRPDAWLAWAGQRAGLTAGTIAANVSIGDDAPDPDAVARALALACASELDPDRELGVQGAGLSGGQAQRVAVARAFYGHLRGRAAVIALDEPSAALDADTEARLWEGVRAVADAGATVLLVSHRVSARAIADGVVRLGDARSPSDDRGDETERPAPAPVPDIPRPPRAEAPATDPAATSASVLRGAMPPLRRFWPAIASGFVSEASAVALLAVSAWLIVRASEQPLLLYLSAAVVGVRLFALTRAVFRYLERLTGHDAALRRLAASRSALVRRLIPVAPDGLSRTGRGSVLAALVDDVDELQNLPLRVVQPLLSSMLVALGGVVLVAFVSGPAALTMLGCLVAAAVVAVTLGWAAGARADRSVAPLRATLSDALLDHLGSLDVLIAYGVEASSRARVAAADARLRAAVVRRAGAQAASSALVGLLAGLASLAAVLVAAPAVAAGSLDAPGFAVAVLVPMAVFEVFAAVPMAASAWRQVRAAAGRIAGAVPALPVDGLVDETVPPTGVGPALGQGVRLRGVGARWPDAADSPALSGIDLDVGPGERVLVVGSSGAGKTTLAHVLVRFLDARGEYSIGGRPVSSLAGDDVRLTVGLCEQHPMLFDEDIRQNLLFARDTATDADLEAALERVGLGPWLRERGGLDARVGERGALVSGGQAQRIALARALLRGFPVLVLDEPTAGVDPAASDLLLADLLGAVGPDQAVVLISHVAPPAGFVDRVVRLGA